MARRGLTPDQLRTVALDAAAHRAIYDRRPVAEVVDELRRIAGDRTDLLAEAAGMTGGALGVRAVCDREREIADALCSLEMDGIGYWIALGQERASSGWRGVGPDGRNDPRGTASLSP